MEPQNHSQEPYLRREKIPKEVKNRWEKQQEWVRNKILNYDDYKWDLSTLKYVAGVDVSFSSRFQNAACACLIIWDFQNQKVVHEITQYVILKELYIPGFLAFRQLPPTLQLFRKLKANKPQLWPQLIIVDGNGILHKNGCGYASHLGVVLGIPTIGCAKSFFDIDGLYQQDIQGYCGDTLTNYGENIVIKGKSGKQWCVAIMTDVVQQKAIFISIGTKICLKSAVNACLKMLKFQIPDPVRLADRQSRGKIKKMGKKEFQEASSYNMIYLSQGQSF